MQSPHEVHKVYRKSRKVSLTDETSRELKALSFVCALMVVAIHCWSSRLFFEGEADLSSLNAGVLFFLTASLSRTAVPCFFVLTGFFLARGFQPGMSWYWTAIKKRFLSIFVPLLVWNVLNVALLFAFGKVGNMSALKLNRYIAIKLQWKN